MLDRDSSFYLISLNILITCLLKNVWILKGEVLCESLLGVKGLNLLQQRKQTLQHCTIRQSADVDTCSNTLRSLSSELQLSQEGLITLERWSSKKKLHCKIRKDLIFK